MNIVWITSEAVPFAKTGGLADVSHSLPQALAARGHNVYVIMPYYPQFIGKLKLKFSAFYDNLKVPMGDREEWARILEYSPEARLKYLFVEHNCYFDRPFLYDWHGTEYGDNPQRFIFLSRAAMEIMVHLKLNPDILHANDWHAALCPVYLRSALYRDKLPDCRSVLTIHNIGYQGCFDKNNLSWTGLGWEYFNFQCLEYYDSLNFLKGGIMCSDMVSTVSPTYAREILSAQYGFGLQDALHHVVLQGKLRGILNGIDITQWDPAKDQYLPAKFSAGNLAGKAVCKAELQRKYKLPVRKEVPLFAVISRLAQQKGLDVLAGCMEDLLQDDIQFVMLTSGDKGLEGYFSYLAKKYPQKFALFLGYAGEDAAHLTEAGADFFVMPSRYEPCGLNQMYSMAYGTLPIVRSTGGLADTVINCNINDPGNSTGFVLWDLYPASLANTIRWAERVRKEHPDVMKKMQNNAMTRDFSWDHTAGEYEAMYHDAHL